MSQNREMELHMSNIIGATARINTGKVEYVVESMNEDGTYNLKGEKSSRRNVAAEKLVIVREALVEHAAVEVIEAALSAPESAVQDAEVSEDVEAFDPREDRRQSAYGLAILAEIFRRNPNAARLHNRNPLKPIGSKRPKVRKRVKAQRARLNRAGQGYNALVRQGGYDIKAA